MPALKYSPKPTSTRIKHLTEIKEKSWKSSNVVHKILQVGDLM